MLFCMDIMGMQQESSLILTPNDVLYKIMHDSSLQSIGRLRQTCKLYSNDDDTSPTCISRVMSSLHGKYSVAYVDMIEALEINSQVLKSVDPYHAKYEDLPKDRLFPCLRYFAKKKDHEIFDLCYNIQKNQIDGLSYDLLLTRASFSAYCDLASFLIIEKNINPSSLKIKNYLFLDASKNNDSALAKVLIEKGAKINYTNSYELKTALHWASINNNLELAKFLIENKANINLVDQEGISSLDIMKNKPEFKELIDSLPFFDRNYVVIQQGMFCSAILVAGVTVGGLIYAKKFSR